MNQGANVLGKVYHSMISNEVLIEKYTEIYNSVLLPGVIVRKGAKVYNAIVANDVEIKEGQIINENGQEIVLVYE